MIDYLRENMYTIIVLAVLIVIVVLIIRSLVNKKSGICTGDCSTCGSSCSSGGSKYKVKTVLTIDGMMCGMCETHIQEAIRNNFDVKKVKASHQKGTVVIMSEHRLDDNKLKDVIRETGYTLQNIQFELAK